MLLFEFTVCNQYVSHKRSYIRTYWARKRSPVLSSSFLMILNLFYLAFPPFICLSELEWLLNRSSETFNVPVVRVVANCPFEIRSVCLLCTSPDRGRVGKVLCNHRYCRDYSFHRSLSEARQTACFMFPLITWHETARKQKAWLDTNIIIIWQPKKHFKHEIITKNMDPQEESHL
jgi:hypothetical protein